MLCYRDRAYCGSDCVNSNCDRFFSEEDRKRAQSLKLMVQFQDFSADCINYDMPENYDQPEEENIDG